MDKNKKIIVGLIFAITSILAGLSLYVSWQLRREISPDDTVADTGPSPTVVVPTKDDKDKKDKKDPTKIPTKVPTVVPTKVPTASTVPSVAPTSIRTTVSVSRGAGGPLATITPSRPLPQTALINDRIDAAIMGSFLVLSGFFLYKKYLHFGGNKSSNEFS